MRRPGTIGRWGCACFLLFCISARAEEHPGTAVPGLVAAKVDAALRQAFDPDTPLPPLADDEAFLRRVSLDLTGKLPSPEEVRTFIADRDPQKRAKLIDRLL